MYGNKPVWVGERALPPTVHETQTTWDGLDVKQRTQVYIYIDKPVKPVYWSKLSFIVAHFHVESLKVVVNTAKYLVLILSYSI